MKDTYQSVETVMREKRITDSTVERLQREKGIIFYNYTILTGDIIFLSDSYQRNVGQNGGKPKLDLNVEAAWAQGYTGKNVTTAIMDDGKLISSIDILFSSKFLEKSISTCNLSFPFQLTTAT